MRATEHTFGNSDDWQRETAAFIADSLRHTLADHGRCTLGLSGGSTPAPVYETLAGETIDWDRVTIVLADERCVASTDPQSNQWLVRTTLLDRLPVQPTTVFPDTSLLPDACTDAYDEALRALLSDRGIDVLVLGLGPDGHTASLFPPVPAFDPARYAVHTQTDTFAVRDRISVTPPILRSAHTPLVLLKGSDKISLWHTMTEAPYDPVRRPLHAALAGGNAHLYACP
jgi:6-phosphogluconolactonase